MKKVETLQAIVINQATKSLNYSVVLREAHERAIIHNTGKSALKDILTGLLLKGEIRLAENFRLSSKHSRQF